jgi:hypothetical protein
MIISSDGARRPVSTKAWDIPFQRKDVTHIEEGTSDATRRAIFVEMKQQQAYGRAELVADGPIGYSGIGATQKLENDRVTVWESVGPTKATFHTHYYAAVAVTIGGPTPRAEWIPKGTVHTGEGAARGGRVYVFEIH